MIIINEKPHRERISYRCWSSIPIFFPQNSSVDLVFSIHESLRLFIVSSQALITHTQFTTPSNWYARADELISFLLVLRFCDFFRFFWWFLHLSTRLNWIEMLWRSWRIILWNLLGILFFSNSGEFDRFFFSIFEWFVFLLKFIFTIAWGLGNYFVERCLWFKFYLFLFMNQFVKLYFWNKYVILRW